MNLQRLIRQRLDKGSPVRTGLVGAGKFGSMFLAQVPGTAGLEVTWIADLDPQRARDACTNVGWSNEQIARCQFSDDAETLIAEAKVDVVVEATGDPIAGIRHARQAIRQGRHLVMVNVEADVLAGPLLAAEARQAGLVYSMAYGDQPALICELVDWARSAGFQVIAAGKGTKYLPSYHGSTPDAVWGHYGLTPDAAAEAGMNPQMFNSFLDGTKSAIEMAAVSNATGLEPAPDGLLFPPCGTDDLSQVLRPPEAGGCLHHRGQVEVVSSLERDGRPVYRDLRWGVYVVFEAPTAYSAACFTQYGLQTDDSGRYASLYKPFHLIGLELGISVLNAALRGEPTGCTSGFHADVAAVAKRPLLAGQQLDGEGGHCVWGRLMPASLSLRRGALPIGLAHGITVVRNIGAGEVLCWSDVDIDETHDALRVRRDMEAGAAPKSQPKSNYR
jgi:predicted homoserine dehydrogenase-like protein